MRWRWLAFCCAIGATCTATAQAADSACVPIGRWIEPGKSKPAEAREIIEDAADRRIVVLGEHHDQPEHQRWALHTIVALHGRRPDLVLGFEAFPRRVQPVLDRWVAGQLDERNFLAEVDWYRIWGHDPASYLPIFHFARQNRVRLVALNVDRAVVTRVGREGLAQVPVSEREGVGDPAPARPSYLDRLADAYRRHQEGPEPPRPDPTDPRFLRFVDAQLLWDRAMAEALNAASRGRGEPLVVGLMGAGHLEYRNGVPAQLAALGRKDVYVMLPWNDGWDCGRMRRGLADAVFGMGPPATAPPAARMGAAFAADPEGARVARVVAGSIAAAAGLRPGDVVLAAADQVIADPGALGAVIRRQPPGTLLPLVVRRGGLLVDLVAPF
jgi:uncharacterized iron-regulated protein